MDPRWDYMGNPTSSNPTAAASSGAGGGAPAKAPGTAGSAPHRNSAPASWSCVLFGYIFSIMVLVVLVHVIGSEGFLPYPRT